MKRIIFLLIAMVLMLTITACAIPPPEPEQEIVIAPPPEPEPPPPIDLDDIPPHWLEYMERLDNIEDGAWSDVIWFFSYDPDAPFERDDWEPDMRDWDNTPYMDFLDLGGARTELYIIYSEPTLIVTRLGYETTVYLSEIENLPMTATFRRLLDTEEFAGINLAIIFNEHGFTIRKTHRGAYSYIIIDDLGVYTREVHHYDNFAIPQGDLFIGGPVEIEKLGTITVPSAPEGVWVEDFMGSRRRFIKAVTEIGEFVFIENRDSVEGIIISDERFVLLHDYGFGYPEGIFDIPDDFVEVDYEDLRAFLSFMLHHAQARSVGN